MTNYSDRWIDIDDDGITIRGYYFPWGTRQIRYSDVTRLARVNLGLLTGRARIWGTANPATVWASFDPRRPTKKTGFLVKTQRRTQALMTPDDPELAERALRERLGQEIFPPGAQRGRIV
ncbi:MAG: hypothetical protein ACP5H2_07800 [Solirubrobacteraceae bacterium]